MPIYALTDKLWFPPVGEALDDGLLAIGGDLSFERLIKAYRNGIFPWYEDGVPLWWSPDPRFVLFPEEIKISKSMKSVIRKNIFEFKYNTAFPEVLNQCRYIERKDQDGTWINNDMVSAYLHLHEAGYAVSAEAFNMGELVGGLYGIRMGKLFFGESMFSLQSNASKFAFISLTEQLKNEGVVLIDCQVYTPHLESLGARMITRKEFLKLLEIYLP